MQVEVNKKTVQISENATLGTLAQHLDLTGVGTAMAVNNKMIPRGEWETYQLVQNDKIVMVKAACGG